MTEKNIFKGDIELLKQAAKLTKLPIIRKDFIETEEQIEESAQAGAAAVLLIAARLQKEKLAQLIAAAQKAGLDAVVEIYDENDLEKIAGMQGIIIGVNNRDLKTYKTDVQHALQLISKIPQNFPIIAESAFKNADQLKNYCGKIDAALIGTALLTATDPLKKLASFKNLTSLQPC